MISAVGVTILKLRMLSSVVPYSKAKGPPEFSEMLPPREEAALEAGSTVKSSPSASAAWMACRVMTPAWARMVLRSLSTARMALSLARERTTALARPGMAPPVRPVPPPRGTMGKPSSLARATTKRICSVVRGVTTSMGNSMRRSVASVEHSTSTLGLSSMQSGSSCSLSRFFMALRNLRSSS